MVPFLSLFSSFVLPLSVYPQFRNLNQDYRVVWSSRAHFIATLMTIPLRNHQPAIIFQTIQLLFASHCFSICFLD